MNIVEDINDDTQQNQHNIPTIILPILSRHSNYKTCFDMVEWVDIDADDKFHKSGRIVYGLPKRLQTEDTKELWIDREGKTEPVFFDQLGTGIYDISIEEFLINIYQTPREVLADPIVNGTYLTFNTLDCVKDAKPGTALYDYVAKWKTDPYYKIILLKWVYANSVRNEDKDVSIGIPLIQLQISRSEIPNEIMKLCTQVVIRSNISRAMNSINYTLGPLNTHELVPGAMLGRRKTNESQEKED